MLLGLKAFHDKLYILCYYAIDFLTLFCNPKVMNHPSWLLRLKKQILFSYNVFFMWIYLFWGWMHWQAMVSLWRLHSLSVGLMVACLWTLPVCLSFFTAESLLVRFLALSLHKKKEVCFLACLPSHGPVGTLNDLLSLGVGFKDNAHPSSWSLILIQRNVRDFT